VAAELKMTEGAVKVAVHRLRRRYRELLRDEIAQTVATEDQIDEEIRHLFAALAC
jgi:RNA polymerase sigma-70 factor (ECF subfamily)